MTRNNRLNLKTTFKKMLLETLGYITKQNKQGRISYAVTCVT